MKVITFLFAFIPSLLIAQLKSPADFLGYELGSKFTRHHQVVSYYKHLEANSDQVELIEYGRTYENRPLLLAFVSTSGNLQQKEQIRTDNLKRAGMLEGTPGGQIGVTWLSYNVHGNEASGTEASMATIYELVKDGADKKAWLEKTMVIIDPCVNPDGRDRYVNFYWENANQQYNPDLNSIEHKERQPWGRSNHYLFDLNRDWAWLTQLESQARIKVYNEWMPQIHVDFHEQFINNPYYFAPAAQPFHELITPFQRDFQVTVGKNNARYFDENGWFYFTKESFDLLYPSYGDTYPMYNGAIGMTYEQAGHTMGGLGVIKQEGDTLTLVDRLTHHHTTGLSTIEIASQNMDKLLEEFGQYFGDKPGLKYKTFILKYEGNDDKFNSLKSWLDAQGIKYGTATASGLKGYNYETGKESSFSITANDLVVTTNQPKATFAHILFEPKTKLVDSLSYDLTAWGIPYAYGVKAYATKQVVSTKESAITTFKQNQQTSKTYAFVAKWNHLNDARFLSALLKENINIRFTEKPINYQGQVFEKGSLVISRLDNKHLNEHFEFKITVLANQSQRQVVAIKTGFMNGGPDIGSPHVKYLKKPQVALLKGDGVSSLSFGAYWHFMEQELGYPVTVLGMDYLSSINLNDYQVLVMPDGSYGALKEAEMKKLTSWISAGGRLIAVQGALKKWKDTDHVKLSSYHSAADKGEKESTDKERAERKELVRYENIEREGAKNLSQAIFNVAIDNSHPLAFGYGDHYYTLKTRPQRLAYLPSENVGLINGAQDLVSGFAGQYVKEDVVKSLAFGVERKGAGAVVYFADDPLFRSFWHNGKLLVANALFFVGQ